MNGNMNVASECTDVIRAATAWCYSASAVVRMNYLMPFIDQFAAITARFSPVPRYRIGCGPAALHQWSPLG